jgi:hypothetical protein
VGASQPTTFSARTSPAAAAKKAKKTRKVLIVPVHWTGTKKLSADVNSTKKHVKTADAYFNEVSGGKVRLKVSRTLKWQKIKKPSSGACNASVNAVHSELAKVLRKNKIKTTTYDHVIVRFPSNTCGSYSSAGEAELGGRVSVLVGAPDPYVLTHELGHNLGLPHGNSLSCSKGKVTLAALKSCSFQEYGDYSDVMGFGDLSYLPGPQLDRVGWLKAAQKRTYTAPKKKASKTYSLRAITSKKSGVKAVRVKVNAKRSYWLEYRDGKNGKTAGSGISPGVQIRLVDNSLRSYGAVAAAMLDARPGGRNTNDALVAGESWRSPEGIRFTFSKVSGGKASVKVQTKAPVAKKPKAPTKLGITSADRALKVKFTRPSSAGAPVNKYRVEYREVGQKSKSTTVDATSVKSPTVNLTGLKENTAYEVRVRASNEKGWGKLTGWKRASTVNPVPHVEIEAPAGPLILDPKSNTVVVYVKAQPNKHTNRPIARFDDVRLTGPDSSAWSWRINKSELVSPGRWKLTIQMASSVSGVVPFDMYFGAYDSGNHHSSASRTIQVKFP